MHWQFKMANYRFERFHTMLENNDGRFFDPRSLSTSRDDRTPSALAGLADTRASGRDVAAIRTVMVAGHGSTRRSTENIEVLMDRRSFLTTTGAALVAATVPDARAQQPPREKARFRTGLVAYSYRQALQAKTMTYEDLIRIAVETGTDGIDMTVYWLPATTDDCLLPLRRFAYRNRRDLQHRHAGAPRSADR
jgi:hypothetical protein